MAIVRTKPESCFTVLNNELLNDRRLGFDDVGLLVYLLSKPPHWRISVAALRNERKHGRDWVYKRISNLEEAGYIVRQQGREEGGKMGEVDYYVYDTPQEKPLTENTEAVDSPVPDFQEAAPLPDLPYTANPTLENKDIKKELNSSSGKPSKSKYSFADRDMAAAKWMRKLIAILDPNSPDPNLEAWANEIRLMRERDNRTYDEIRGVFEWANSDPFWKSNILSPAKLRKQFSALVIKIKGEQSGNNHIPRREASNEVSERIAKRDSSWARRSPAAAVQRPDH